MTIIRKARREDAQLIAEYNSKLALETEGKPLDPATILAGVEGGIARTERCQYFVALKEDEIVGQAMITFEWSDWRNGELWWLQSVYVHPDHRGGGVFKSLYRHIEQLAREHGQVRGLRLYVEVENETGQSVYAKLGMTHAGYHVYECVF